MNDQTFAPVAAPTNGNSSQSASARVIEVNAEAIEIPDLKLLALFEPLPAAATQQQVIARQRAMTEHITEVVDFLDRVVVGGTKGIPLLQLDEVMAQVNASLERAMRRKSEEAAAPRPE